jgi:dTDP-4-amino-4,6-dideoxygalactose transaminase
MAEKGISANVHYIPMPMLTLFKELGHDIKNYPVSYDTYVREISLPIYPQLTNEEVDYVINSLVQAYEDVLKNA